MQRTERNTPRARAPPRLCANDENCGPIRLLTRPQRSCILGAHGYEERRARGAEHGTAGDQRAQHKTLLVLYTLGRGQQGNPEVTYAAPAPNLPALIRQFGPPRKSDHPEQPFWRLQFDTEFTCLPCR